MLTKRQEKLLNLLTQEYIKAAKPVGSEFLEKKSRLGICPATIRNEMQELTDSGYLFQPHTSAGRVPTDKAYRFFVDNILEKKILDGEGFLGNGVFDFFSDTDKEEENREEADIFKFAENLAKKVASVSSSLAFVYFFDKDILWKEGFKDVFRNPEFRETNFAEEFLETADFFEKKVKEIQAEANAGLEKNIFDLKIYIGKEKSVLNSDDFSLIVSHGKFLNEEGGLLAILGPKRMTYDKNICLINSLIKELDKN